jgi:hypothetical protein
MNSPSSFRLHAMARYSVSARVSGSSTRRRTDSERIRGRIAYVIRWRIQETDMRTWKMRLAVFAEHSERGLRSTSVPFNVYVALHVHDVDDCDHKDDDDVTVWLVGVVVNGEVRLEGRETLPMPMPPTFVDGGPYPLGPL